MATPDAIAAAPDAVTVVVVQPTSRLRAVGIVDGRGQLVGQLDDRCHTVVHVPEGPTVLYAVLENRAETADRLEGTLIAGRVYYATVGPRAGGVALLALEPAQPRRPLEPQGRVPGVDAARADGSARASCAP